MEKKFEEYFAQHENDRIFVLTDLMGGSVNQKLLGYSQKENVTLITGTNLPVLMQVMMADDDVTEEEIQEFIDDAREELQVVNLGGGKKAASKDSIAENNGTDVYKRQLYENYAKQGDMTLEDFVKAQGISMDDFEEQGSQYAEYKVKQNLIVQGIMDAENMTLEDEKSLAVQDELIQAYGVKDLAALVDKYGQAAVDESIGLLRVEDFILDNATGEEKVTAGDTEGENGDDPSTDGSSAEGEVDEELETAEAADMVPAE